MFKRFKNKKTQFDKALCVFLFNFLNSRDVGTLFYTQPLIPFPRLDARRFVLGLFKPREVYFELIKTFFVLNSYNFASVKP